MEASSSVSRSGAPGSSRSGVATSDTKSLDGGILFPFFDHMTQSIDLPFIFYFAVIIWFVFQNWVVVLWVPGNTTLRLNDALLNIALMVFNITCWVPLDAAGETLTVRLIMLTAIFVVSLGFTGGLLFSFLKTRRFVPSLLAISRVTIEVVPCLMTYPTAAVAGLYLADALKRNALMSYVLGVLAVIQLIGFLIIFYLATTFWGATPYLPKTPFAAFDITPYNKHTMGICVLFLLSIIAPALQDWFVYVVVGSHMALSVYLIYLYCYRPFLANWLNIVIQSFSVYGVIMDIVNISYKLSGTTNPIVFQIIMWLFMVVAAGIAFTFDRCQEKIIRQTMQSADDEEDAAMSYDHLAIDQSEHTALFYLNYAISHYMEKFVGFRFIQFIVSKHHNATVISHCARVISWFPGELRGLGLLCNEGAARKDLGFSEKFILYQLARIRLLRESSASSLAADRLNAVTIASKEVIQKMRSFWGRTDCSLGYINQLSKDLARASTQWQEAIDDFPNGIQFRDTHITFLIEAAAKYQDAVAEKAKTDLLESGVHFRADMGCYKRFIYKFPLYLKRRILDINGNRLKKRQNKEESSTEQTGSTGPQSGSDTLDAGMEEGIGRHILKQGRVRLTVERALEDRHPNTFTSSIAASVFLASSCCVLFFYLYFAFSTYFDSRRGVAARVEVLSHARAHYFTSLAVWVLFWGKHSTVGALPFSGTSALVQNDLARGLTGAMFTLGDPEVEDPLDQVAQFFYLRARTNLVELLEAMAILAQEGQDLSVVGSDLYKPETLLKFCQDSTGDPLVEWNGTLLTTWIYQIMMNGMMKMQPKVNAWFQNNTAMCSIIQSVPFLTKPIENVRNSLSHMAVDASDNGKALLVPLRFALPLGLLVFQVIWWSLASWRYVKELNDFARMLLTLPKEVKKETMRPVRKDLKAESEDESLSIPSAGGVSLLAMFNSLVIFLFVGMSGLMMGQIFNCEAYNNKFMYLNTWSVNARGRLTYVLESSYFGWLCIFSYGALAQRTKPYLHGETFRELTLTRAREYMAVNTALFEDDGVTPISTGLDEEIDRLSLEESCQMDESGSEFHDLYQCGSMLQLMQVHFDLITQIYVDPGRMKGVVTDPNLQEMDHLIDRHLLPVLSAIESGYARLLDRFLDEFRESHMLFFVFEMVLNIAIGLVAGIYVYILHNCYVLLLRLMRRVSPVHILASEELEAYLLGIGMSTHERIISASQNSIICMNSSGVIEMVNPGVSKTLGYASEQILSLPLVSLMNQENSEKISQQMNLMANHQSSAIFEGHTVCVSENQTEVSCSISILALFAEGQISQFVAILKDESALLEQRQAAENAKQQSENLLYQILPRSIVTRIKEGERDISFTVPSATIIFIDIVKFSQYAANLTPQEIMGNLSLIFTGFDDAIKHYDLLLKIKLIGDVYMAAAGLFDPERPPTAHAEQMIRFALDALRVIEEMNERLNSALAVRIGINTGGPVLAGVLGTDKPTFDIIGDPINIAARLQSTDVPGSIQISEATRDAVAESGFDIKPRGKVFLKGKGEQQTFLIEPARELEGFQTVSQPNLAVLGVD